MQFISSCDYIINCIFSFAEQNNLCNLFIPLKSVIPLIKIISVLLLPTHLSALPCG